MTSTPSWFSLGRGVWLRRFAYVVIAYGILEVVAGTDKPLRLAHAWHIFALASLLLLLASYLGRYERLHGPKIEVGASIIPIAFILAFSTGTLHHRLRVVPADVKRFDSLPAAVSYPDVCPSDAVCLLLDPGGSMVQCYSDLKGVEAQRVDLRVRVDYDNLMPESFEIVEVRVGDAWQPISGLVDYGCFGSGRGRARSWGPFSYWRL